MLSRSFFQKELQLNHVKHKQVPAQVLFATLTHDDQMKLKPVNYLVKHETVHLSLKDDCYPGLAHFRNDQFPTRDDNEAKKNVVKTLDFFSFVAVHPVQVPLKNKGRKMLKL